MTRLRLRRPGPALAASGLLAFALLAAGTGNTLAGWTTAQLGNPTNSAATGAVGFTHTMASGTTCTASGATTTVACGGTLTSTAPAATTAATVSDTLKNTTTKTGTFTEQMKVSSCGPAQFRNGLASGDPMLPRYGVAFQQADPWGGTSAADFDGSTGYAADTDSASLSSLLGTTYSIGVWFKTTSTKGGGLLSFDTNPTTAAGSLNSPALYLDSAGKVHFKSAGFLGTPWYGSSTASYNDGKWHLAVLTVSGALVSTATLYVDGTQVASGSALGLITLQGNGYWHLGWLDTSVAVSGTTAAYFDGSLAGAYVSTAAQSAATVTALAKTSSAASYASALSDVENLWMLDDDGLTTYTGSIGYITGGDPCTSVTLQWTLGSTTTTKQTLRALVQAGAQPSPAAAAPAAGASQTITSSYARAASYDADVAGLHLVAPYTHTAGISGSSWQDSFTWNGLSAVFIG